jgi:hypothetical protein
LAPITSASSSGEEAEYFRLPDLLTGSFSTMQV